jgi:hypothetical protein
VLPCSYNNWARSNERNILVMVDNAASHAFEGAEEIQLHGLKALKLSNLTILFLPPNVTSHVQPLDQGIIAAFKARYRRYLMRARLARYDLALLPGSNIDLNQEAATLRDAVIWIHAAWHEMPIHIFINCFRKSGEHGLVSRGVGCGCVCSCTGIKYGSCLSTFVLGQHDFGLWQGADILGSASGLDCRQQYNPLDLTLHGNDTNCC